MQVQPPCHRLAPPGHVALVSVVRKIWVAAFFAFSGHWLAPVAGIVVQDQARTQVPATSVTASQGVAAAAMRNTTVAGAAAGSVLTGKAAVAIHQFQKGLIDFERHLAEAQVGVSTLTVSPGIFIVIISFESMLAFLAMAFPLLLLLVTYKLRKLVEKSIKFDKAVVGVGVEIQSLTSNVLYGMLDIQNLVVKNPEDKGYASPYLLRAATVHFDFNRRAFLWSWFRRLEIQSIVFKNVHVTFEKTWDGSNVQDMLDFLQTKAQPQCGEFQRQTTEESQGSEIEVIFEKVLVEDMDTGKGEGHSTVALGDICYDDFSEGAGAPAKSAENIAQVLLQNVLKTVCADAAKEHICGETAQVPA